MSERLTRVRHLLAELDVDAILISHPANRRYVSGFPDEDHAPDETSGILFISGREARLFVSPTNLPWALASAGSEIDVVGWQRPWQTSLGAYLKEQGTDRVAFEDRALIVADYDGIRSAATGVELVPAGTAVHRMREVKDAEEVSRIRDAARITDEALRQVLAQLRPGTTEKELVWHLESTMRDLGADGPAFPTGVGAGPHGARPHHSATDRPIGIGEPVVIDMGARVDGYCADLTRTVVLGDPTPLFRERYNLVLSAQQAAIDAIRPGMTGREADAAARDIIEAAGVGEAFFHGLGHGVGLLIHEAPSLGQTSDDVLQPGHLVTIEPGIYFDGWGGIRIEDLAVVTESGIEILSNAPKWETTSSMIDTGDLRKGLTFDLDGRLVKVVDFQHNKQGRGSAQVRMTLRDLRTGSLTTHTVQAGAKFPQVRLERQHVQYLYPDGDHRYFMDTESFDQIVLDASTVGDNARFIRENDVVDLLTYNEEPIDIELPPAVVLTVTETDPGLKGDTASGATKPATLETGLVVNVPLFINIGDNLKVDTRSGDYIERVN